MYAFYDTASSQKKKWGVSADIADTDAAPGATNVTQGALGAVDTDNIALSSQGRATRLGKFKSLIDALLAHLTFQVPAGNNTNLLSRGAGNRSSFSRPNTVYKSASGLSKSVRSGNDKTSKQKESLDSRPGSSIRPSTSGGVAMPSTLFDNTPVNDSSSPPPLGIYHLALFGRLLGIFPCPIVVDRPAITHIVTLMLVHLTSPKVNMKKAYDGRPSLFNNAIEPTIREVQPCLAEAIYGATTSSVPSAKTDRGCGFSMIPIKKVINFLKCLCGGVIDPHWAIAPHMVPCVECSAPVPWSSESLSKLLSLLLLRSSSGSVGNSKHRLSRTPPGDFKASTPPVIGSRKASLGVVHEPTRLDALALLYETSNHIKELWGEPLMTTTTRKQVLNSEKQGSGTKASLGLRRISSVAMSSQSTLVDSDVVCNCIPVRDYITIAIKNFNTSCGGHGRYWPSDSDHDTTSRPARSMSFPMLTKDITLSKLANINFNNAIRLAGNRVIDLGFAIYICIEAWSAEVALVEKNMRTAISSSLRKTAMSLTSLNPNDLRPLTLPEKKCLSDIITYYLFGEVVNTDEDTPASFVEKSLSRIESFCKQSSQTIRRSDNDIFASVDLIARGISWHSIRRNHHKQFLKSEEGKVEDSPKKLTTSVPGSLPSLEEYTPPDSPALRTLLKFRDVELCHYTVSVAKTVVKRSLWEAHMSDRSGWVENYYWYPIQLEGQAKADIFKVSENGVSFEDLYLQSKAKEEAVTKLDRMMSIQEEADLDLLDRSDLEAANMIDTSSESETEESTPIVSELGAKRTIRAMSTVRDRYKKTTENIANKRKILFTKNHPLSYMSDNLDHESENVDNSVISISRSTDSLDSIPWRSIETRKHMKTVPGFVERGRITTADISRRKGITCQRKKANSTERETYSELPVPRYLDENGTWKKWPTVGLLELDNALDAFPSENFSNDEARDSTEEPYVKMCQTSDHDQSIWLPNDSTTATGNGLIEDSNMSLPKSKTLDEFDSEISLLAYLRGHRYDPPKTPARHAAGENISDGENLLRIQSPAHGADPSSTRLDIGSTAYAQEDPYYYFQETFKDKNKIGVNSFGKKEVEMVTDSAPGELFKDTSVVKPTSGSVLIKTLKRQPSKLARNGTSSMVLTSSNSGSENFSDAGPAVVIPPSVKLEKSKIAPALTRLAERMGNQSYLMSEKTKAAAKYMDDFNALQQAYSRINKRIVPKEPVISTDINGNGLKDPDIQTKDYLPTTPVVSSTLSRNLVDAYSGKQMGETGAKRNSKQLVCDFSFFFCLIMDNDSVLCRCME